MVTQEIHGFLCTYLGQGEPGIRFCFQDKEFIFSDRYYHCLTCGLVWDKHQNSKAPPPTKPGTKCDTEEGRREHHRFVPGGYSSWSPEGMITLHNGDHLTIFGKDDSEAAVWSGTIDFEKIHIPTNRPHRSLEECRQIGIDAELWNFWFESILPGKLIYTRPQRRHSSV